MKTIVRHALTLFLISLGGISLLNAQWKQTTLDSLTVEALTVNGANLFAGTYYGGVFLSTNSGTSWTAMNNGLTNTYVQALCISGTDIFAGTIPQWGTGIIGEMFRSTDNGTSWTEVDSGLGTKMPVQAIAVSGANLFTGTLNGLFLSTNNGTSWVEIDSGLASLNINALAVSASNLFAGTYDSGVFLSTNNGARWSAAGLTGKRISAFSVSGSNLFAGTGGRWGLGIQASGVFLSTDNGTSWTEINTGLANKNVTAIAVSPNGAGGTNLFAGTNGGVFLSTNNGTSWTDVSSDLTNTYVRALAVSGTYLYAGTEDGVWRRAVSEMITSVERHSVNLPLRFSLDQNYPNPFNPTTTISFGLPSVSFVSLRVFDALGREISTLVSELLPSGTYSRLWNAAGLPSGVYFYRLNTGSFVETRKLILLR